MMPSVCMGLRWSMQKQASIKKRLHGSTKQLKQIPPTVMRGTTKLDANMMPVINSVRDQTLEEGIKKAQEHGDQHAEDEMGELLQSIQ